MAVFGCSDPTWRAHCEKFVRVDPPLVYTFWKLYPMTFSKHINIWGLLHAHPNLYGYLCLPFVMNHPNFLSKRAASLRNGPISFFFRVGNDRKFILFWSFLMWGFQKCQIFNVIPHLTQVMPLASHALNFCKNCNMESHFHFFLYHHFQMQNCSTQHANHCQKHLIIFCFIIIFFMIYFFLATSFAIHFTSKKRDFQSKSEKERQRQTNCNCTRRIGLGTFCNWGPFLLCANLHLSLSVQTWSLHFGTKGPCDGALDATSAASKWHIGNNKST